MISWPAVFRRSGPGQKINGRGGFTRLRRCPPEPPLPLEIWAALSAAQISIRGRWLEEGPSAPPFSSSPSRLPPAPAGGPPTPATQTRTASRRTSASTARASSLRPSGTTPVRPMRVRILTLAAAAPCCSTRRTAGSAVTSALPPSHAALTASARRATTVFSPAVLRRGRTAIRPPACAVRAAPRMPSAGWAGSATTRLTSAFTSHRAASWMPARPDIAATPLPACASPDAPRMKTARPRRRARTGAAFPLYPAAPPDFRARAAPIATRPLRRVCRAARTACPA
jgi:hypothetical protein